MNKSIFVIISFFFSIQINAQDTIINNTFGITFITPNNWELYSSTVFDTSNNECVYTYVLPEVNGQTLESEWDNSVTLIAKANGYAQSLENVVLFERQRLHREYDDIAVLNETDSSLLISTIINGSKYQLLTLFTFKNNVGYLLSYSYDISNFEENKAMAYEFFSQLAFFKPSVSYRDIEDKIAETPEDATLYFQKAQREFGFHDFNNSLLDCTKAIEHFPFFAEAFYLRGYLHIALGDSLAACLDFQQSISNDYAGESEILEFCNTKRMSDAMEKATHGERQEEDLFKDFDPNANHMAYTDSIRNHKYVILSYSGNPNEEVLAYLNHLNHLFMLDFSQLDSLFHTETGILQLYAFGIICRKYPNNITNEHKKYLKVKTKTAVLDRTQLKSELSPTKEIASRMYESINSDIEDKKEREQTEKAVKSFIQNYARLPETYQPISFEEFHVMRTIDGNTGKSEKKSETYIIGHRYQIKDSLGEMREQYNTFKFMYDFQLNIIEGEETNTYYAYPPQIKEWIDLNGRVLSAKEKQKFGIE